jgi:hypothetical protein
MRYAIIKRWQELESQLAYLNKYPPQWQRYIRQSESVPTGFFIPLEIVQLEFTSRLSKVGVELLKNMLPEGSFVQMWNPVLKDACEDVKSFPTHKIITEWGYPCEERCYPLRLRLNGCEFFWGTWLPNQAPKYLKQRIPEAVPALPRAIPTLEEKLKLLAPPKLQSDLF